MATPDGAKPRLHPPAGKPTDPISDRHRAWGSLALATDIDLILVEWSARRSLCALIDYKLGLDRDLPDAEAKSVMQIGELGERAEVPAFCVKYSTEPWLFRVYPLNTWAAGTTLFARGELITELQFVDFLYRLRGHDRVPDDLRPLLDDRLPR